MRMGDMFSKGAKKIDIIEKEHWGKEIQNQCKRPLQSQRNVSISCIITNGIGFLIKGVNVLGDHLCFLLISCLRLNFPREKNRCVTDVKIFISTFILLPGQKHNLRQFLDIN
jgi:hypothetical protein